MKITDAIFYENNNTNRESDKHATFFGDRSNQGIQARPDVGRNLKGGQLRDIGGAY